MKREKIWHIFGMLLGVAAILAGVFFISTPAWSGISTTISKYDYSDSSITGYSGVPEDTSFGGDYYTYEYGATRSAAITAHLIKKTIDNMCEKLALYVGAVFILVGLLLLLNESRKLFFGSKCADKGKGAYCQMIPSSSAMDSDDSHNEGKTIGTEIASVANTHQTRMSEAPVFQPAKKESFNYQAFAQRTQLPEQGTKLDHFD